MKWHLVQWLVGHVVLCLATATSTATSTAADPLPSWNEGETKRAILEFVERVTDAEGDRYVPPAERIATFDNDGTLWAERPVPFQLLFNVDRLRQLAPQHPEWQQQQPFQAALAGHLTAVAAGGGASLEKILAATQAGMTTDAFAKSVRHWLATARHPQTGRPYTEMVYQPMLELLAYLRAHDFKIFIVSGGGSDFMRVFTKSLYGVPQERVIGSYGKLKYAVRDGEPVLIYFGEIDFVADKHGKLIGIHRNIGRRPIFAFGNSDGDLEMLEWTRAGGGPRFAGLVHHTDSQREWAYGSGKVQSISKALTAAKEGDWDVIDMKRDWRVVFPAEKNTAKRVGKN